MVTTVLADAGGALRSTGPGPQQLLARWQAGQLNPAERMVVLLGGASFHDPALLPMYAAELRSPERRLREAAAVGLYALIGDLPLAPSSLSDTPETWERLARFAGTLAEVTRRRSLVHLWADSYAAAARRAEARWFVFNRTPEQCLRAIRELAQPEDLPELLALWPLLESFNDRGQVMRTIEMITLQRLVDRPLDPHKPWGDWLVKAGLARVDDWVARSCRSLDGTRQLQLAFEAAKLVARGEPVEPADWFEFIKFRYPAFLPLAIERLAELSGSDARADRQSFENPANTQVTKQLMERLPISSNTVSRERRRR